MTTTDDTRNRTELSPEDRERIAQQQRISNLFGAMPYGGSAHFTYQRWTGTERHELTLDDIEANLTNLVEVLADVAKGATEREEKLHTYERAAHAASEALRLVSEIDGVRDADSFFYNADGSVKLIAADSTNVALSGYDPRAAQVHVVFHSSPSYVYIYDEVTRGEWDDLCAIPSVGQAVGILRKGKTFTKELRKGFEASTGQDA